MSNLRKQNIQESYFLDTLLDVIYSQKLQEVIIYEGNISLAHKNIIIATANSNTQMNGVVKKITDVLQDKTSINVEGKDSTWLLIEVKEVLIHIFNKDSREFYNLEDIYFDCELIINMDNLIIWGCSSVGRALAWHARGQGFKSPQLHKKI